MGDAHPALAVAPYRARSKITLVVRAVNVTNSGLALVTARFALDGLAADGAQPGPSWRGLIAVRVSVQDKI